MHPILTVVSFGGVAVPLGSYGALLCLAIGVGSARSLRAAHRDRLDLGACIAALGVLAAGAFAGAAVLHAVAQIARTGSFAYALYPVGLAYFGAVLGGGMALLLAGRALGVDPVRFADLSVPAIATAHAIGRVGCFLGGCCHGVEWHGPWAATYAPAFAGIEAAVPRHPVPLYEAAVLAVLAIGFTRARDCHQAAMRQRRFGPGSGKPLAAYFALYATFRIAIEPLRGDTARGVFLGGAVSTSQITGAVVLAVCLAWLAVGTPAACVSLGSPSRPGCSPSRSVPWRGWRLPTFRARCR